MEQFHVEYLVVGAGVVGLAVARALAMSGKEVWVVEQESNIGMQTSSRNSEVIHAGIYYPKGSLKAQLCVRGRQLLYAYCEQYGIAHRRCGKLIVAKDQSQIARLQQIREHALGNGVTDLQWLDQTAVHAMEPCVGAVAALFSPSTGILDSHGLMHQLQADFERHGGQLVFNTELQATGISAQGMAFNLVGQNASLMAKHCVNAAGLNAVELFKNVAAFPASCLPKASFAKGSYFAYNGKVPFSHLIYPIPEPGGLGVHLTIDIGGLAKFGPDVEWLSQTTSSFDYQVDPRKAERFVGEIQTYWPTMNPACLVPGYSGIRPKITGQGEPVGDFVIQDAAQHGIKGLVNLLGIESPGLTSALAIAERVSGLLV